MSDDARKLPLCVGCDSDFYNGKNGLGVKRCWLLDKARIVTRYKIGWWTEPTSKAAFTKIRTLHCHTASGRYALYEKLPEHLAASPRRST